MKMKNLREKYNHQCFYQAQRQKNWVKIIKIMKYFWSKNFYVKMIIGISDKITLKSD